jgi:hypothetical protein
MGTISGCTPSEKSDFGDKDANRPKAGNILDA